MTKSLICNSYLKFVPLTKLNFIQRPLIYDLNQIVSEFQIISNPGTSDK